MNINTNTDSQSSVTKKSIKERILPEIPWIDEIPNTLLYIATYGLSEMLVRTYMHDRPRIEILYHIGLLLLYYYAHVTLKYYKQTSPQYFMD